MKGDERIGDQFQELTKYSPNRMRGGARPTRRPEPFKSYPGAKTVKLDKSLPEGSLWRALETRRSRRSFTGEAISLEALSRLVFAAQGATALAGRVILRTAPSAGALYPVELYLVVNQVEGVEPGAYHYNIRGKELSLVREGRLGRPLAEAALGQGMCARASAVFVFTAIADRCKWKYAQRAYRYIYLDAGHIGENIYLAAQDLGIGCCAIGAFFDDKVNDILKVDGKQETAIYLIAAGPVREGMD